MSLTPAKKWLRGCFEMGLFGERFTVTSFTFSLHALKLFLVEVI